MRRWGIALTLALGACAGPAPRECAMDDGRPPGLVERLARAERAVRDLRAEDARRDFEYVLEVLACLPPGLDARELRQRAADGLVRVRGILYER
jgi:hypothetical protein